VPEKALTELQGNYFVWVVSADNQAAQRPVKLGPQVGGSYLVVDGLNAGERIIVEGLQKARQGQPVQPITLAEAAARAAQPSPPAQGSKAREHGAPSGKE
jgi:membrane fusion protein (multidrug efflux system)